MFQHKNKTSSAKIGNYKPHLAMTAAWASMITVGILIIIKSYAVIHSGSASVLASLVDSIMDAGVSLISFLAIRLSLIPADEDHRFGHGKVEGLAALFQSAFIAGGGVFLMLESLSRFFENRVAEYNGIVIAIIGVSVILSLALVTMQKIILRSAPSLAVEADSTHYGMDVIVNLGVMAVLLALSAGIPLWIDPLFALCVAFYLFWTAYSVAGKSLDMLLDRELPDITRSDISRMVTNHPAVFGMHDLRTRVAGMKIFISFDVELDPNLNLEAAHNIVREVEHSLFKHYPHADILIHPDPHGDIHDTRHQVRGVHDRPL